MLGGITSRLIQPLQCLSLSFATAVGDRRLLSGSGFCLLLLVLFFAPGLFADSNTTPQLQPLQTGYPGITRQQGDAILQELRAIRKLLQQQKVVSKPQARKRPVTAKIKLGDHPFMGSKDAPVTMVEFTDYQCPYCKRFHDNTFPTLKKKYIDTGKLRYVAMDLPLRFHPRAKPAANAALCANEQGQFWQMRGLMFKNSRKLEKDDLLGYAGKLKMDVPAFEQCLTQNRYAGQIQKDIKTANGVGFTGTPSFVIGKNEMGFVNGAALIGAKPLAEFEAQIRQSLPDGK